MGGEAWETSGMSTEQDRRARHFLNACREAADTWGVTNYLVNVVEERDGEIVQGGILESTSERTRAALLTLGRTRPAVIDLPIRGSVALGPNFSKQKLLEFLDDAIGDALA